MAQTGRHPQADFQILPAEARSPAIEAAAPAAQQPRRIQAPCQELLMSSSPKSFTNFMQNVVKNDTFWGAEIELEYSTDKKLGVQVSGFTIK